MANCNACVLYRLSLAHSHSTACHRAYTDEDIAIKVLDFTLTIISPQVLLSDF